MNKKAFTLVELLAVIIILSLIALLTTVAVTRIISDSKQDLYDVQIKNIEEAAKTWAAENLNKLPSGGDCGYITVEDLKDYGLLDSSIINPKTNTEIPNTLKIKITTTINSLGRLVTEYVVDPSSVDGCSNIY